MLPLRDSALAESWRSHLECLFEAAAQSARLADRPDDSSATAAAAATAAAGKGGGGGTVSDGGEEKGRRGGPVGLGPAIFAFLHANASGVCKYENKQDKAAEVSESVSTGKSRKGASNSVVRYFMVILPYRYRRVRAREETATATREPV